LEDYGSGLWVDLQFLKELRKTLFVLLSYNCDVIIKNTTLKKINTQNKENTLKTTTYENKIARVTFTKNDKRVIEIYPNDLFVSKDCDDQCLFVCSLIELKKSSITLHINEFKEKTNINEIFQDETALQYFKEEELFYNKHNRTYQAKGELLRTMNTEIFYPMSSIRSIQIHHSVVTQTFKRD
jgi:hypothetical protein